MNRALDVGCAVGRSSFELARSFDDVIGIDFSHAFIAKCNALKNNGFCNYVLPGEGELGMAKVAKIPAEIVSDGTHYQYSLCQASKKLFELAILLTLGQEQGCLLAGRCV